MQKLMTVPIFTPQTKGEPIKESASGLAIVRPSGLCLHRSLAVWNFESPSLQGIEMSSLDGDEWIVAHFATGARLTSNIASLLAARRALRDLEAVIDWRPIHTIADVIALPYSDRMRIKAVAEKHGFKP